jgi:hypothetical protein
MDKVLRRWTQVYVIRKHNSKKQRFLIAYKLQVIQSTIPSKLGKIHGDS